MTMPSRPPVAVRVMASVRNCSMMSRRLAPSALRTPISRVRSVTETSMMFMTPTPPTTRPMEEMASVRVQATQTMTALLASIAGVSLLVGGIGIMNIMLVSVTERTREIGLRMAIGARGRDVLLQFLVEAVVLSLFGGAIGIGLGFALSQGVTLWMSWPTAVSPQAVVVAFGFAAITGVFFGFYPARKAAALDPIDVTTTASARN